MCDHSHSRPQDRRVLITLVLGLILVSAACGGVEMPQTEPEAIDYVKNRLSPAASYDPQTCRSFLRYADWSAYRVSGDKGWHVGGAVYCCGDAILLFLDTRTIREIQKASGNYTWLIQENGEVMSLGLPHCDLK